MHFLKQQDIYFHFGMLAFKARSYYNKFILIKSSSLLKEVEHQRKSCCAYYRTCKTIFREPNCVALWINLHHILRFYSFSTNKWQAFSVTDLTYVLQGCSVM